MLHERLFRQVHEQLDLSFLKSVRRRVREQGVREHQEALQDKATRQRRSQEQHRLAQRANVHDKLEEISAAKCEAVARLESCMAPERECPVSYMRPTYRFRLEAFARKREKMRLAPVVPSRCGRAVGTSIMRPRPRESLTVRNDRRRAGVDFNTSFINAHNTISSVFKTADVQQQRAESVEHSIAKVARLRKEAAVGRGRLQKAKVQQFRQRRLQVAKDEHDLSRALEQVAEAKKRPKVPHRPRVKERASKQVLPCIHNPTTLLVPSVLW